MKRFLSFLAACALAPAAFGWFDAPRPAALSAEERAEAARKFAAWQRENGGIPDAPAAKPAEVAVPAPVPAPVVEAPPAAEPAPPAAEPSPPPRPGKPKPSIFRRSINPDRTPIQW